MALSPQKFREIVLQLLYSSDLGHSHSNEMIDLMMNELAVTKKSVKLAQEKSTAILSQLQEIDPLIASVSASYTFDRIQTVTKNILRLAVYELLIEKTIPHKIVIAEAIRLSRKFSTPESATFANALLDNLYKASVGSQIDKRELENQALEFMEREKTLEQAAIDHLSHKADHEAAP